MRLWIYQCDIRVTPNFEISIKDKKQYGNHHIYLKSHASQVATVSYMETFSSAVTLIILIIQTKQRCLPGSKPAFLKWIWVVLLSLNLRGRE